MIIRSLVLIVGILVVLPSLADVSRGDKFTAEELYLMCKDDKNNNIECINFIKGARAGMTAQRMFMGMSFVQRKETPPKVVGAQLMIEPFCLPEPFTDEMMKETVMSFLEKIGAEKKKSLAGFAVLMAFNSQFPCTENDFKALKK